MIISHLFTFGGIFAALPGAPRRTSRASVPGDDLVGAGAPTASQEADIPVRSSPSPSPSPKTSVVCDTSSIGYNWAPYDDVLARIDELKTLGPFTLGHRTGGGWCGILACTASAHIDACNDNDRDITVRDMATVVGHANRILDTEGCHTAEEVGGSNVLMVRGQAFDAGGWNLVIGNFSGNTCS